MTFSEANREFKILQTSHKKALNNIILAGDVSHFNFIEKYPLKFHSNYKYLVNLQSDFKLFQQITTVLYCFVGTCSSTTLSIA